MNNDKILMPIAGLLMIAVVVGCGGGGASSPTVDPDTVLNGYVINGPLVGAKVCLDNNSNWVCDVGEPTAMTGAKGAFELSIAPLKFQNIADKQLIAEVGPDALNESSGVTLHAAGQGGYVLAARGGQKPILSPMGTLQTLKSVSGYSPQLDTVSVSKLLAQSGLSTTEQHYFDDATPLTIDERALAKRSGRLLASLMSSARKKLQTDAAIAYSTDTSQLGARAAEMVVEVLRSSQPVSASESDSEALQRLQNTLSAIPVTSSTESFNRRAVAEISPDAALSVLGQGLVETGALGSSPRFLLQNKVAVTSGEMSSVRYRYISAGWSKDMAYTGSGSSGHHLIYKPAQGGEYKKISTNSPVFLKSGSLLNERFSDGGHSQSNEVIVLTRNLSGLSFNAVQELTTFTGFFAQGESVYWLRRKATADQYLFDSVATFFTSLSQFRNSPQTCFEGICWSITSPAKGNADSMAGRMIFRTSSSGGNLPLGEGSFVEDTVAGVSVLRMISVPINVQNRSQMWSAKDGRTLSFADIDGKLWSGKYMPSGTVWYSNQLLTTRGVNVVLTSAQLNTFEQ
jgi:hypothetical protein